MTMKLGRRGERTLNLPSTVLPQCRMLKLSLYSAVTYTDKTYVNTRLSPEYCRMFFLTVVGMPKFEVLMIVEKTLQIKVTHSG